MSDMNLTLRLTADGRGLQGELRKANGEVVKFGDSVESAGDRGARGLRRTEKAAESTGRSLNQVTSLAKTAAVALGAAFSVQAIGRFTGEAVRLAIAAEETGNKFRVVMGPAAGEVNAELTALTDIIPLTVTEMKALTAGTQDMLVPMGLARDEAAALSVDALRLAGDLASFNDTNADEVLEAIRSGLAGSSEPLRRYGVDVREARLQTIALEEGLIRKGEELDNAARAQALFAAITRDSTDAIGDAARTVDSSANQVRFLRREARQLAEDLGGELQPSVDALVAQLSDIVGVGQTVVDNWETVEDVAEVLALVIGTRLALAVGTATAAKVAGTVQTIQYQLALARLAGVSTAAAASQVALAAGSKAAGTALTLVGGPVGALVLGLAGLVVGVLKTRSALKETGQESDAARLALGQLQAIASSGWQPERIDEVRSAVSRLRNEISEAELQLENLRRLERARSSIDSQARQAAGLEVKAPDTAISRAADRQQELVEGLREQVRLSEQLSGLAYHEDMANGIELVTSVGAAAINVLERFGVVTRNAGGGLGEMAAASDELTDPLERQVQQLEVQLRTLRDGAGAAIDYQEGLALAAAAQADAENSTTRNTEAVRAHFDEIRRLTGEIDAVREAQEQANEEQERAAEQREQAAAYQDLVRSIEDEIRALTSGEEAWEAYQRQMFIAQQVAGLGPTATEKQIAAITTLAGKLFDARQAVDELGNAEDPIERLLSGFRDSPFAEIAEDIRDVEAALQDAFENAPEKVSELRAVLGSLRQEMLEGLVGTSTQALRSIQQLTGQGSKEYRAMAVAIEAANVALAVAAILNQGMGDPYTAFFRMAAMATAVASLVGSINANFGGISGGDADERQRTQGAGTVLGDNEAKSESILRASEITADATSELVGINRGMLRALRDLQDAIAGASGLLARGAGDAEFGFEPNIERNFTDMLPTLKVLDFVFDPLGLFDFIGKWLGGSSKVTDTGIEILGGTIAELIDETLIGAYQDIEYKKWKFGSTKRRSEFVGLDDAIAQQFALIFDSIADTVFEAAVALGLRGDDIERAIQAYEVQAQKISLMDLSAEEQQAELNALFSSIFDGLAAEVVPFVGQFQEVGEGIGETLVRVATGVQVTEEAVKRLGFALDETDPERFAQASEGLIAFMGGIDQFVAGITGFFDKFASDALKLEIARDELTRGLEQMGLTLPETRDGFWELMQSLDASTEAGREQIATLLELRDSADEYYNGLERVQQEREGLERQLLRLQGDTVALRELELAALDPANRRLQEAIWLLEDRAAAEAEAAAVQREREGLEKQLLTLQGDTAALRELELATLDPANRALQEHIWLLEDEAAAAAEAAAVQQEREGLEKRLLTLLGDTAALRELELAALDPANRRLQETIWLLEDRAAAEAEAAAVQEEREGLERQLLELQGDTAAVRELELAALDPSNRALQERIWALEDEQAATAELNDIMSDIEDSIASLSFSPLVNDARELKQAYAEQQKRMRELGATEAQFQRSRLNYTLQVAALAKELEESIKSALDEYLGRDVSESFGSSLTQPIDNAAGQIRDSLISALEDVDEWLRRSAFENPSLTPRRRFEALQSEFYRLVSVAQNGSGQAQLDAIAALPQLASQLEAMGVQMFGSATQEYGDFRSAIVAAMEEVAAITVPEAVPDPVTGSQVTSIESTVEAQRVLAEKILQEIGALVSLGEGTAETIAEKLGVPLADVIETLIGSVDEMTLETVDQLLAVANTLGMDLADVAAAIDVNIGELTDQESLFSQALQDAVGLLPQEIQSELLDPLSNIWEATNEADANAAIEALKLITQGLPQEYQELLAPFIEGIDPQDPLDTQIGLLEQLQQIEEQQLSTLEIVADVLDRIRRSIGEQNDLAGIPGFAAGGWVNRDQVIRAGEAGRELVLPNPVSEFFVRSGIPVNAGMDDARLVAELTELRAAVESGNRDRRDIGQRTETALIHVSRSMDEAAREARSKAGMNR